MKDNTCTKNETLSFFERQLDPKPIKMAFPFRGRHPENGNVSRRMQANDAEYCADTVQSPARSEEYHPNGFWKNDTLYSFTSGAGRRFICISREAGLKSLGYDQALHSSRRAYVQQRMSTHGGYGAELSLVTLFFKK
jgi:hypothetical protein